MKKTLITFACLGIITSTAYLGLAYRDAAPMNASAAPPIPIERPMQWNRLKYDDTFFTVEVPRTPQQFTQGLMHRRHLPDNHGMLFVFDKPDLLCFWMKNTPLPLSIAFLDDEGAILHIADMTPYSLSPHCTPEPVRLALEMPQGWFTERGLSLGSQIHL